MLKPLLTAVLAASFLLPVAIPGHADLGTAFDTIDSATTQARNVAKGQIDDLKAELATAIAERDAAKAQSVTDAMTIATLESKVTDLQSQLASAQAKANAQNALIAKLRSLAPAGSVALVANPATINPGESSTLALSAVNTETCVSVGWDILSPIVSPKTTATYEVNCADWRGDAKSAQATVAVTIPPPPPVPDPIPNPTPNAADTITVANVSGTIVQNYPLRIGRPFVCGEIAHYPQIVISGAPIQTQADVKNRCPDGSVKFAVISAVLPSLPATGDVALNFQDQPTGNNTAVATADLLAQFPDFDAVTTIAGASVGAKSSASARQMLTDGACKPWTSGPVAQTMICADRSAARAYDIGSDAWRSLHPEFVVTFWPATKQVFVRYVGEISNTQALEAFPYDLDLTAGKSTPQSVYKHPGIQQSVATRWTRTAWLGGMPQPKININHNIGYLADSNWLPNYDRSLKIPESELALTASRWATAGKKIGDAGLWMKYMPNVSYHADIGHMPLWMNQAIFSGDWRMREAMLGQADLAGAFPAQVREGDPKKKADRAQAVAALGLPVTVYARPTSWLFDFRSAGNAADALVIRSPKNAGGHIDLYVYNGFIFDYAHQPDPFFVPYLMTGDPFYLDGLQLWAGYDSFMDNPGYRFGPYAVIYDGQNRSNAWVLRTRLHAALASPDDDPMKSIFNSMIDDALAYWEGVRNFTGTKYETSAMWKLANNLYKTGQDGFRGLGPHPLGWFVPGLGAGSGAWDCATVNAVTNTYYDTSVCATTNGPWQENFLILEFGRAVELGYAADRLFAYVGQNIIGQLISEGYNNRNFGRYQIPDAKKVPTPPGYAYFQTWGEVMSAWAPLLRDTTAIDYWPQTGKEFYWDVARGAAGMTADKLPNGALAWQKLGELIARQTAQTGQAPNWNLDPTWAIVPRVK
jgi:multidrug efflux pump subunit AcrA (membrane-fusion protein)